MLVIYLIVLKAKVEFRCKQHGYILLVSIGLGVYKQIFSFGE